MPDNFRPDDGDLNSSINDFEAALTAKRIDLQPPEMSAILVAIDGSNQSEMTIGIGAELARRTQAVLHLASITVGAVDPGRDTVLEQHVVRLTEAGLSAKAVARPDPSLPAYTQITRLAASVGADLIIVPAPFLEDFDELGADSVGVTLDKLMTQPLPLLVVRQPRAVPAESLNPILFALSVYVQENPLAAAWALRIIGDGGTIQIVAVVDDAILGVAAGLIGEHNAADLDLDHYAGLDQPATAGLIAAIHRSSLQRGVQCQVVVQPGDLVGRVAELAEGQQRLIVTGCDTDPGSVSYRNVQALIRRAKDPVLVV